MWLYASLLMISVAVPLVMSFDKHLRLYRKWAIIFPVILVVASGYIAADVMLTKWGVWGFNPAYHLGIVIFGLPIEEWLFFVVIPYSSLFVHYTIAHYLPRLRLPVGISKTYTVLWMIALAVVAIKYHDKMYTVYIAVSTLIALTASFFDKQRVIDRFHITFGVILIPFMLVNGVLTGSFFSKVVVWYHPAEIMSIRIFTIPIEDFAYCFSLILFNLLIIEQFKKRID